MRQRERGEEEEEEEKEAEKEEEGGGRGRGEREKEEERRDHRKKVKSNQSVWGAHFTLAARLMQGAWGKKSLLSNLLEINNPSAPSSI